MARDPREPRNEYGRAITEQAACQEGVRRYANQPDHEDYGDCVRDRDRNDLGSERAADAMWIENYHRHRR